MRDELLDQLERAWYGQGRAVPDLKDLFAAAVRQRDRYGLCRRVSVYELLSLVYEALDRCLAKYDPAEPRAFRALFETALLNGLRHHLGLTRAGARRRARLRLYARETCARHIDVADPLTEWVDDAVAALPPDDEWLVRQLYWQGRSLRGIARQTGIDKSKLSREHCRILHALKDRFVSEMWGLARAA